MAEHELKMILAERDALAEQVTRWQHATGAATPEKACERDDARDEQISALAATVAELRSALTDVISGLEAAKSYARELYAAAGDRVDQRIAHGQRALAADPGRAVARVEAMRRVVEAAREIGLAYRCSPLPEVAYIRGGGALDAALRDLDALEDT